MWGISSSIKHGEVANSLVFILVKLLAFITEVESLEKLAPHTTKFGIIPVYDHGHVDVGKVLENNSITHLL